MQSQALHNKG